MPAALRPPSIDITEPLQAPSNSTAQVEVAWSGLTLICLALALTLLAICRCAKTQLQGRRPTFRSVAVQCNRRAPPQQPLPFSTTTSASTEDSQGPGDQQIPSSSRPPRLRLYAIVDGSTNEGKAIQVGWDQTKARLAELGSHHFAYRIDNPVPRHFNPTGNGSQ